MVGVAHGSHHNEAYMDSLKASSIFKSLGHPIRLQIYRKLLDAGEAGMTVGELHTGIEVCGSTLSQHITRLTASGLVSQQREGKAIRCLARNSTLKNALASLER